MNHFKALCFVILFFGCSVNTDNRKENWLVNSDSTILWIGNEVSGNNFSNNPSDYSITFEYLGIPSAPNRTDKNRVRFTLVDSAVTEQDYESLIQNGINNLDYFLRLPSNYTFIDSEYNSRSVNGTPAWYRFTNIHYFNCNSNSSIDKLDYVFRNGGSIERSYSFSASGLEEAFKSIAC